jgi:hypothetical protein
MNIILQCSIMGHDGASSLGLLLEHYVTSEVVKESFLKSSGF